MYHNHPLNQIYNNNHTMYHHPQYSNNRAISVNAVIAPDLSYHSIQLPHSHSHTQSNVHQPSYPHKSSYPHQIVIIHVFHVILIMIIYIMITQKNVIHVM